MHVGDAAVGGPRLGAVDHPFVGCLVVAGTGDDGRHVRPSAGFGRTERRELRLVDGAEHLRQPLAHLLGGSGRGQRRRGEAGAEDGQGDSGIAPEQLLEHRQDSEPAGFGGLRGEQLHGVQAHLGRLLDDRPRRLLALVPLRRCRPHHLLSELVDPVPHLDDVLGRLERKRHGAGPFRVTVGCIHVAADGASYRRAIQ